jgi:hypothetical protein
MHHGLRQALALLLFLAPPAAQGLRLDVGRSTRGTFSVVAGVKY